MRSAMPSKTAKVRIESWQCLMPKTILAWSMTSSNGGMSMEIYKEKIDSADSFDALCAIVESAADDDFITNEEYCAVYALCLNKAQTMGGSDA